MDEHEDSEKRERVLLRPWLENLIEGGSIPGLEWMDDTKTTFKVPWKHRSKKTWSLQHSSIFLEWAKNTGRWSEGDPEPNYAQLKTRLRCAFNKAPDIEEMKELHRTKSEEPYKVYKFIPRKESKLYPFGRRPLRKTTVPITVRRRRYLISRISSSGNGGGRLGILDGSAIRRVKLEKEEITDVTCSGLAADRRFNVTADSKDWTHPTWLAEKDQAAEIGTVGPWSTMYNHKVDSQTVNRILPLIVEEENFNSSASFELDLPPARDSEQEPKTQHLILSQISRDCSDPLQNESMISIPKLLRDEPNPASVGLPFYSTILPSPSLPPEKQEFRRTYDSTHHRQDSSAIYVSSPLVDLPRNDSFISGNDRHILPHAEAYLQDQATKYHGAKQPSGGATAMAPKHWAHAVTETRSQMKKQLFDSATQEQHGAPLDQSSENFHRGSVSERRPSLIPAARLFPLKNRYIQSQNALCASGETSPNGDVVPSQRQNAVVKPNAVAQPQVAVATPYGGKLSLESESLSNVDGIPEEISRDLIKKNLDVNTSEAEGQSAELEVMDLSTKVSDRRYSESKVLDLTKKMVVTPFERDCHVTSSPGDSKNTLLDGGKEMNESLLSSDPAALASKVNEILKFKADYKRKKQMIVTKTMILVEKERELKAREKQLAAREEALFWKESYLHKVMSSTDVGTIPSIAATQNGATGPFNSLPVMKETSPALPTVPHLRQNSPVFMSGVAAAGARHRVPVATAVTLTRPEPPGFVPSFQVSSRPVRPPMSSVASGPAASLFSHGIHPVSMNNAWVGEMSDQNLGQKAIGCMVLPPVKRSIGNETADPLFEPEANVALGDANPVRKSYCVPTEKTESENAVALSTMEEVPSQSLVVMRKRGRPKGSKNKIKLPRLSSDSSAALRQMPPLLIIQSPPQGPDPSAHNSLPVHILRNPNISGITLDPYKSADVSSVGATQAMESSRDQLPSAAATISYKNYTTNRILPPVTSDSSGDCSSPHCSVPTSEVSISTPVASVPYSLYDHIPNREIMPETVRQLLMSASKPVSNILPPLSPPKSPEEFSHEIPADAFNLCSEKTSDDEKRMIKSIL